MIRRPVPGGARAQTLLEENTGTRPDPGLWRCAGCGYVNVGEERCESCHAAPPAATAGLTDEPAVAPAWTPVRELWEQVHAEERTARVARLAAPAVRPALDVLTGDPFPPTTRSRRGLWLAAVVATWAFVAAVFAAWQLTAGGTSWPKQWDPRVAPIAAFDEAHRGLKFRHPVPVVFLSDLAFRQKLVGGGTSTSADDQAAMERLIAELRALGLTSGDPQLETATRSYIGSDVEGFYDPRAKAVWVKGDVMTPHLSVVLAHELTHVLQDQNFGIHHPSGDDADAAYRAVIEADAVRIQNLYLASLSTADRQAFHQVEDTGGQQAAQAGSAIPPALIEGQQFPYAVGPHFIDVLMANGGTAGIDAAIRRPPASTLDIIEPSRYLAGTSDPTIDPPAFSAGEHRLEPPSTLGSFEVFEILADQFDTGQAWNAARTWSADSSVVYSAGGRTCVRIDLSGSDGTHVLESALHAWTSSAGRGTVTRNGAIARFDVCDPGASTPAPRQVAVGPLEALVIRGELAHGIGASANLQPSAVDCVSDVVLQVAGDQGLQGLVQAAGSGDPSAVFSYSASLGVRARPTIRSECPSALPS